MRDEWWDGIDCNGKPLDQPIKRGDAIPEGVYHRVVEIYSVNSLGEVLITKRHPKKHYGHYWEITGGSIMMGESMVEGALRELKEETGLTANPSMIEHIDTCVTRNAMIESFLVWIGHPHPRVILCENETVDYRFLPYREFKRFVRTEGYVDVLRDSFFRIESLLDKKIYRHSLMHMGKILSRTPEGQVVSGIYQTFHSIFPKSETADYLKIIYQGVFGPRHFSSTYTHERIIDSLIKELQEGKSRVPLVHQINSDWCWVSLDVIREGIVDCATFAHLFLRAIEKSKNAQDSDITLIDQLALLCHFHKKYPKKVDVTTLYDQLDRWIDQVDSAPSHSLAFKQHYHPHYRLFALDDVKAFLDIEPKSKSARKKSS
ncbi:MAG: NUDIX hydrolase [Candidatus Izemoplasmatales bacterium]|nr:NUDIX hydrolase [Candidatus Izemoplasmatales bacterium]